jgi:hypothetical protein
MHPHLRGAAIKHCFYAPTGNQGWLFIEPAALVSDGQHGDVPHTTNPLVLTLQQALRTGGAMAVAAACFLAVAALHAAIMASPAFAAPRQRWYEGAKGRVMALGELTMGRLVGLGRAAGQETLRQQLLESMRWVHGWQMQLPAAWCCQLRCILVVPPQLH